MEAKIKMVQQKNKLRHYEDNILINNAQRDKKKANITKREKEERNKGNKLRYIDMKR